MSRRQRREVEDAPLKDMNCKRPHYDLRHNHIRQCCSLPQYDKRPCQHKYHLRPFEHRKPGKYFGIKQALSSYQVDGKDVCAKIKRSTDIGTRRNAHSYSINGHMARCSNSSTASGRRRTLLALKEGSSIGRHAGHHKEVSQPPKLRLDHDVRRNFCVCRFRYC